jgi:hypothetical protein
MPGHDPRKFISPTALMLSMRAMVEPGGPEVTAGFALGAEAFTVRTGAGYSVARAEAAVGDVVFEGGTNAVASAIYGPRPLAEVAAAGGVRFTGDLTIGQAFVDRFSLRRGAA